MIIILLVGCTTNNGEPDVNQEAEKTQLQLIAELEEDNLNLSNEVDNYEKIVDGYTQTIQDLNGTITTYREEVATYKRGVEAQTIKDNIFPALANLSLEFVRAQTSGDLDKLQALVSDDITFYWVDEDIYCRYFYEEKVIELPVYIKDSAKYYQDMVIQGYGYIEEDDIYLINIAEFMTSDSPSLGGIFLNLSFEKIDGSWKVIMIEFDI